MTYEEFETKLKEIKKRKNKWYFKIPIIGNKLKMRITEVIKDECISLHKEYIRLLIKEDWNNKTKEQQYEIIENVINTITEEMGLYTKTNWNDIIKDLQQI